MKSSEPPCTSDVQEYKTASNYYVNNLIEVKECSIQHKPQILPIEIQFYSSRGCGSVVKESAQGNSITSQEINSRDLHLLKYNHTTYVHTCMYTYI